MPRKPPEQINQEAADTQKTATGAGIEGERQGRVDELHHKRPDAVPRATDVETTSQGGPLNEAVTDPVGPPAGGAGENSLYRPGQRTLAPGDVSVETAPQAVSIPFGSEPRTYDPATGQDHPGYKPVSDEDTRSEAEAREAVGLGAPPPLDTEEAPEGQRELGGPARDPQPPGRRGR